MTIETIELSNIVAADYNPAHRSEPEYVSDLIASIARVGQVMPAVVVPVGDGRFQLVDGHRRATACRELGIGLKCLVTDNADPALYAELNTAAKRLSGKDKLSVYLRNPHASSAETRKECERWERATLAFVHGRGGGMGTLKQARMVGNYAGTDYDKTAKWMAEHNLTYAVRKAMRGMNPAQRRDHLTEYFGWGKR